MAIPDGFAGVVATLRIMGRLVNEGKKMLPVRLAAQSVTRNCPQRDFGCEVNAVHNYVRDSIRYVEDIRGVETVQTADKTLELGSGDCDDKAVLVAAMLESIGKTTRFVAIGMNSPDVYEHVYAEVKHNGRGWIPLETTEMVEAGWEPDPRAVMARYVWHN